MASSRGCICREQHDTLLGFAKARNNVLYGQPADLSADNRRKWVEAIRSLEEP
ncbi:MAG: hypothetical protein MJZ21_03610 [archaeon]|nr:hypothetical protein [archaeon]